MKQTTETKGRAIMVSDLPLPQGTALLLDGEWLCTNVSDTRGGYVKVADREGRTLKVKLKRLSIPYVKPLPPGRVGVSERWMDAIDAKAARAASVASKIAEMTIEDDDSSLWMERVDAGDGVDILDGLHNALEELEDTLRVFKDYVREVES